MQVIQTRHPYQDELLSRQLEAFLGEADPAAVELLRAHLEWIDIGSGETLTGYEIHIGRSDGPDRARPFARIKGTPEGAVSADGRVIGSYIHGMFGGDAFRAAFLRQFGVAASAQSYGATVEATLDRLSAHMELHLDIDGLLGLAR